VIGVVTKNGVLEALAEVGPNAPVLAAMDDEFEVADPSEMLEPVLERLQGRQGKAIVVMRGDKILGTVTHHSVGELLTMRRAVQGSAGVYGSPGK
jgi:CBS domain-containing protein